MDEPSPSYSLFRSVLCGTDNSPSGIAARRQAAWLAGADAAFELIPPRALTGHGVPGLTARCAAHDFLVLPADQASPQLTAEVPIPVLLARWCPAGRDVTDLILVAVGDRPGSARAAALAAELAVRRRGSVAVVAAPGRSRDLERAVAAAGRIVVCTTGAVPQVLGELARPALAVARAAARIGASLRVAATGDDAWDSATAGDFARFAACSLLTVPPPFPSSGGSREPPPPSGAWCRHERQARPAVPILSTPTHDEAMTDQHSPHTNEPRSSAVASVPAAGRDR